MYYIFLNDEDKMVLMDSYKNDIIKRFYNQSQFKESKIIVFNVSFDKNEKILYINNLMINKDIKDVIISTSHKHVRLLKDGDWENHKRIFKRNQENRIKRD